MNKIPFGSQFNFITSTFNLFNKSGTAIPPVEFIPSTTILKFALLILLTSINSWDKIKSMCCSIEFEFLIIFPTVFTSLCLNDFFL